MKISKAVAVTVAASLAVFAGGAWAKGSYGVTDSASSTGSHSVNGYTTKDGTYVAPHMQTNPNATKVDNWSSKPNVNPYTGKAGTVDPLAIPAPKQ